MKELTIAATVENIQTVTNFVNDQLKSIGCPMKVQTPIDIVIDELLGILSIMRIILKSDRQLCVWKWRRTLWRS